MECPECKNVLLTDSNICPECGFGLLSQLSQIKNEIGKMAGDTQQLIEKMNKHRAMLDRMEPVISGLLEKKEPDTISIDTHQTISEEERESAPTPEKEQVNAEPQQMKQIDTAKPRATISEIKLGQKWLLIAGVIVTVLAFGWFLKYSFDRNWIGYEGRVALAYIGGFAFFGCGEFFRRKQLDIFGLYLIGGGIATLYFATFAGFQIYHLFTQPVTFILMVLVTALASILALVYDKKWLAVIGLIGGFLTPIILSSGMDQQVALMTYMTVLNAGILTIAFFKEWPLLNGLSFFFTWSLFTGWYFKYYSNHKFWPTLIFIHIFFLVYAGILFAYHIHRIRGVSLHGFWMQLPNSYLTLGFVYTMISQHYHSEYTSIATLAYATLFLWMAAIIYRRNPQQEKALVLLIAKSLLFLVITVPILFSKHWVIAFWSLQALVFLWAAIRLKHRLLFIAFFILRFLSDIGFFFYYYPIAFSYNYDSFSFSGDYSQNLLARWLTSLIIIIGCLLCSRWLKKSGSTKATASGIKPHTRFFALFVIYLFMVLNFEISGFFYQYSPGARFASISVLWALFSIIMLIRGFITNQSIMRVVALWLFGFTLLKIFFIDMSRVSTPYRIISFLVLGMVMIAASYMYYKFNKRLLGETGPREVEYEKK